MKRIACLLVVLAAVLAPSLLADTISDLNITYVTVSMGPNNGSGDNATVTLIGPGTEIVAVGGMACFDWCSGTVASPSFSTSQLFVGPFLSVTVFGKSYNPDDFGISGHIFNDGGFLNPSVSGFLGSGPTFTELLVTFPCCGSWNMNFQPVEGGYEFVHGTFTAGTPPAPVPELGALGFVVTGLVGILGVTGKRRLLNRRTAHFQGEFVPRVLQ
ncbi:MAG TPA: hypothetical protein VF133_07090 [Terriglobales bacterium]